MSQIKIPYEEMHNVASDFNMQAGTIEQAINTLRTRSDQLAANWEGVAQQAFMQELESCRAKLAHTPEMLRQISQALNQTADSIHQAEEAARGGIGSIITSDN